MDNYKVFCEVGERCILSLGDEKLHVAEVSIDSSEEQHNLVATADGVKIEVIYIPGFQPCIIFGINSEEHEVVELHVSTEATHRAVVAVGKGDDDYNFPVVERAVTGAVMMAISVKDNTCN